MRYLTKRHRASLAAMATATAVAFVVFRPDTTVPQLLDERVPTTCPPPCVPPLEVLELTPGAEVDPDVLFARPVTVASASLVPIDAPAAAAVTVVDDRVVFGALAPGRYELHVIATDAEVASVAVLITAD